MNNIEKFEFVDKLCAEYGTQDTVEVMRKMYEQLHDLPKKIVGEIKNELETSKLKLRIVGIDGYSYTSSFLETILKKFGGENE